MTVTEIQEFRQQAFDHRKRAEALLVKSKGEFSEERSKEIDDLLDRAADADKNAKRAQSLLDAERAAAEKVDPPKEERDAKRGKPLAQDDLHRRTFVNYVRTGSTTYTVRDQSASLDQEGGYVAAPTVILNEILKEVDDARPMRGMSRVLPAIPPNGTLGVPFSNNSTLQASWSSELTSGDPSDVEFSGREFKPNYLTWRIFLSRSLLMGANNVSVESYVRGEMSIRAGEKMEEGYMTGTGVGQPLGIFTESNDGVPAGRNTVTAANNKLAYGDVIDVFYELKAQYSRRATWFMHRSTQKEMAKIVDGDMRPLWRAGLAPGDPPTIEGQPIVLSEFAPAFAAGVNVAIVGDFNQYWIVDSTMMDVIRQEEKWAERNQIGLVGRQQTEGAPVLSEAFSRLKVAA